MYIFLFFGILLVLCGFWAVAFGRKISSSDVSKGAFGLIVAGALVLLLFILLLLTRSL